MKKPILLLCFSLTIFFTYSQNIISRQEAIEGETIANSPSDLPGFTSEADAEKIIRGIVNVVGLEPNFKIKIADVPNVEADVRHHQRYILYNPDFIIRVNMAAKDKWPAIFILAHEIGHHLQGHTIRGTNSRPAIELQADEFAGFVVCKMGATLEEAQMAMHLIANIQASKTHPGRSDRLAAIEKGWNKARAQMKATASIENSTQQAELPVNN
jgi:hypothetical protein